MTPGKLIILNGPMASGKSSIAAALHTALPESYKNRGWLCALPSAPASPSPAFAA